MKKQNISQSNGSNNNKTERVKVYIRVRPFNQDENERGGETPFTNLDVENSMVTIKKEYDVKNYSYDGLYDMNSTQEQIFQKSAKVVIDVSKINILSANFFPLINFNSSNLLFNSNSKFLKSFSSAFLLKASSISLNNLLNSSIFFSNLSFSLLCLLI